jgi:putative hydrolase of the HAD superfamily
MGGTMPFDKLARHIQSSSEELCPLPTAEQPDLRPMEGIRAVLFDVYGTLFVSGSGDISLAQNENRNPALMAALQHAGFSLVDREAPFAQLLYKAIETFRASLIQKGTTYPEVCIQTVWKSFLHQAEQHGWLRLTGDLDLAIVDYECRVNPCWPMPDAGSVLKDLQKAGFALGIISNAQFYTPLLFCALLGQTTDEIGFEPDLSVWSYRELMGKPSTELFEIAKTSLAKRGISESETLFIGNDMRNDIWPAYLVGFKTALFAGDGRSLRLREDHPDASRVRPDLVLTNLRQLTAALIR